jgi:hypothetical protein
MFISNSGCIVSNDTMIIDWKTCKEAVVAEFNALYRLLSEEDHEKRR